ncbi:DUF1566 domain-containing protein [Candidatus Nitronereus thalassa]|uniref:DUF1566 domain-containing protein n=1 Tax=Candidatus Nitronereus thalassa TaxID=3020898 RepID=A0ABU3K485_9BACT|nr:DUF1566 domain-containing protein [Candidatus Nitronereus thalassa]MDT7041193.1 DUF1566 domain-containing protein [Candidatus Nitronereus thalassa]
MNKHECTHARHFSAFLTPLIYILLSIFGSLQVLAGNLEPSAPPAPTMKTLEQVSEIWDRALPADDTSDPCNSSRFTCVLGGSAVRDNETGIVWERSPSAFPSASWATGMETCANKFVRVDDGIEKKGWRAPSFNELASLIDRTAVSPKLPPNHPFSNIQSFWYWTATSFTEDSSQAWAVLLGAGVLTKLSKSRDDVLVWCVRGGGPLSEY